MTDKELPIPPVKTTLDAKLYWCELVREKLRREHNAKGADFRDGKLTKEQWEAYLSDDFGPKNTATSEAILAVRAVPKTDARAKDDADADMAAVDLKAVFTDADTKAIP